MIKLQVLMTLKDITKLVVSPVHTEDSISCLQKLISEHRHRLLEVFPDFKLIPTFHFLEHYLDMIKCFGPLVCVWTMRFEVKHNFFKCIVRQHSTLSHHKAPNDDGYHLHADALKSALCVSKITSIPLALLHEEIQESFKKSVSNTNHSGADKCTVISWNQICSWDDFAPWIYWWSTQFC